MLLRQHSEYLESSLPPPQMNPIARERLYKNRVLACLPKDEIKRLAPHLEPVTLQVNDTLIEAGQDVSAAYFLEEGMCSLVVEMKNGDTIEVGVIGKEGVVGASSVSGDQRALNRGFIQVAGSGFRIKLKTLREQNERSTELRACLQKCEQALLVLTAQTAACNRVHELPERLARWILTAHDRVESDRIPLTHEFLGMMLGTGRPTVTLAAGTLQKAGLITYSRGHVTIQDHKRLEDAACECYRTVRNEYARLGLLDGRN
jgi:CRP-like cAMP-binding protein